jgi:hypothetical protein
MFLSYSRVFDRIFVLAGVGFLLAAGPATTGPATTHPTTEPSATAPWHSDSSATEIGPLLAKLTDPRWQVRNRAVERLVELGAAAEQPLVEARAAAKTVDARTRLELVLGRIHESRRSGATYVSLHLNHAPTRDALAVLASEAGVKFDSSAAAPGGAIVLEADHKPFWAVFRELCAQAKLEVGAIDPAGTLTLRSGDDDWGRRPAVIEGPYMLIARRIELTRTLDLANPKELANAYNMVLLAYAEPKLRPIYWSITGIDQCVTDTGHALEMPTDGFEPGDLNADSETHLSFTGPADVGTKLAKLRINARFVLSDKSQRIDLASMLKVKNETHTVGGWRILIKGVTRNDDDRYSAALTVYRDNHTPEEWSERTGLLDRAQPRLVDAAGKVMESGGTSLNQGPDEWNWTDECTPATPDAKPSKLLWDFPLETRHADVRFEFKDLPLP